MNPNEIISYTINADHHVRMGEELEETQRYERKVEVKLLEAFTATYYDPQLKIGVERESKSGNHYEIEITKVNANFSERLKPAEDLYNRSNYLFDWLQLKVRNDGKMLIANPEELADTWQELKEKLLEEYESITVENYLEKMTQFFQSDKTLREAFNQYFYFGLLFPGIPQVHSKDWEKKRTLRLSPFDKETFEEQLQFTGEENGLRNYTINGIALPENTMELKGYTGMISYDTKERLVNRATVDITLQKEDFTSEWQFTLETGKNASFEKIMPDSSL